MTVLQIDVKPQSSRWWQADVYLYEVDTEALEKQISYWISDMLRREYPAAGVDVFDVEVRRYK